MSDDDEDQVDSDANLFDPSLDGSDAMGFGPLIPTESERSLMERVRQELKHELKQVKAGTLYWISLRSMYISWNIFKYALFFLCFAGLQRENC